MLYPCYIIFTIQYHPQKRNPQKLRNDFREKTQSISWARVHHTSNHTRLRNRWDTSTKIGRCWWLLVFFFGIQIGTNRNLGTFETALNNRKLETLLGIWANGNQGSCVPMSVFLPKVAKTSTTSLKRQEDPKMACGDPGSWTRGTTNRETTKKSRNS